MQKYIWFGEKQTKILCISLFNENPDLGLWSSVLDSVRETLLALQFTSTHPEKAHKLCEKSR